MRWKIKQPDNDGKSDGEIGYITHFAWKPTFIEVKDGYRIYVWLRFYFEKYMWLKAKNIKGENLGYYEWFYNYRCLNKKV